MIKSRGFLGPVVFLGLILLASAPAVAEDFEGLIYPSEVVKVSSQVPGILEEVAVERGDPVKKGQVLARLKAGQEKAALETKLKEYKGNLETQQTTSNP
jgi:multidrug efflux pump subunit AcrA (membrane-fusion protein)